MKTIEVEIVKSYKETIIYSIATTLLSKLAILENISNFKIEYIDNGFIKCNKLTLYNSTGYLPIEIFNDSEEWSNDQKLMISTMLNKIIQS